MKRLLPVSVSLLLLSVGLLAAPVAHAQISNDLVMSNYNASMGTLTSTAIDNASLNSVLEGNSRAGSRRSSLAGRSSNAATRPASANSAALSYTVTPALKQKTLQNFVNRLKTNNPTAAQAVADYFGTGKHDYNAVYQDIVSGYGLRANNPADALAAYLSLGWMIANNVPAKTVTPAMMQGVRSQFGPSLMANSKMTPAVAAAAGEDLKLQLVVIHEGWQSAIKEQKLPAYQQGTVALFKQQYGMDMTAYTLGSNGLTRK